MRRIRKILLVFAAVILMIPSFVTATSNDNKSGSEEDVPQTDGEVSSKDEVVYAKLSATGERQEIYVVNILDIAKAGKITDYGPYTSLKNLTDLTELEQQDNIVEFAAPEGKFYYQGNMNEEALPWDISISYLLDGKEIVPEELAGKDGHVQIKIATSANENIDSVFYENYLLQISLSLNLDNYSNIQAPDGMLANAGKNKQVTFTVMPEKEEELVVEADVVNFELDGIDISAVPSSMPIEDPNVGDMTGDMESLTDAIEEINNGVGDLKDGVTELNNGVQDLRGGSKEYHDGISAISDSSSELVNASIDIDEALETMSNSLSAEEISLGDVGKLEEGLTQMADGLRGTSDGLLTLKGNFANAYSTLNEAMEAIPAYEISDEEIQQLQDSDADQAVIGKLLETYTTAQTAKGTYAGVKDGFDAVGVTLEQLSGSIIEMADSLDTMAEELSSSLENMDIADSITQLQEGLSALSSNYGAFHSGLVDYTGGVSQLSGAYGEMHNGIVDLAEGTGELQNGASQLHDGTTELYESTSDLPEQMKEEVDQMMAEYDKSDFQPVSFVSPKNEKINSVQFVFKTESIKVEEPEETEEPVVEEKGFWARLKALF
ncbi:X-X-X-Leu-X-X-Gly heptad repeat protein [Salirhabdus euzebyi]|uniref:X-X-X-Leu-X-X-Gly heptad repeat protein n=1 Tax=Salirhabdus euzebyi TaxID=394506 RepID=A0A841PS82_9BACI|nr:YhgE/Pip domain-containing protein [Salirhabdus euzebyi]MBB6451650.1 X-X-X-Leu-X-X-Gly heptad repeat protein [Salirhabdus euzebyi]